MSDNSIGLNRRAFGKSAILGGLASGLPGAPAIPSGIAIGSAMPADPTDKDLEFFAQLGVEYASVRLRIADATLERFIAIRRRLEAAGIRLWNIGLPELHCDPVLVLGLPGRDEKIEQYKAYLANLGKAGIPYTTYAHMANIRIAKFYQTAVTTSRGGARVREFDISVARTHPPSHGRDYTEDEIWKSFVYFIKAVLPAAERAGVRIGLHQDDPPVPSLGGVARVFRSFDACRRAIDVAGSENFGLCLCVGTWAEGGTAMGKDVFETIRQFGPKNKIFKVHFRNVSSPLPKFTETFVDDGYLDMYRLMKTLREVNFRGVMIPDHVPGGPVAGANLAYTIGYMRALRQSVNG